MKSKGLGDSIAKITKATGIDKLTKKVLGDDCGCEERRKKLNQMFPYVSTIRQFTEDELKIYDEVIPIIEKTEHITKEQKPIVNTLYKSVFGSPPQWKSCSACNKKIMENLKKVYDKSCKI
jgi:hypothetical protein